MKKVTVAWYETRLARAAIAVAMLLLAFVLATYAIDSASLWAYFFALVLAIFSARFTYLAIKKL
jgi:hypothetical protein